MMNAFKTILLLSVLSLQVMAWGQIQSSVSDTQGEAVAWASVSLYRLPDTILTAGTLTDSIGRFALNVSTPGQYLLRVQYTGFDNHQQSVQYESPLQLPPIQLIAQKIISLEAVEISAGRPKITFVDGMLVFDASQTEQIGSSGMDLLRTVPLLFVDKDDNLRIRGSQTKVLINGQDLKLQGEELKAYLQSLSAEEIEKVEVITNPSARWEAEGPGGIINIVLRKRAPGYYGSVYTRLGYGTYGKAGLGGMVSYAKNKFGVSASVYPSYNKTLNLLTVDRRNLVNGQETEFHQQGEWTPVSRSLSSQITANYRLGERSNLSGFFKGSWDNDQASQLNRSQLVGMPEDSMTLARQEAEAWGSYSTGLNLISELDTTGRTLSLEYLHTRAQNDKQSEQDIAFYYANGETPQDFSLDQGTAYDYYIHSAKLDYTHPLPQLKATIETGLKYAWISNKSRLSYDYPAEDAGFLLLNLPDNTFDYFEQIYAAYLNSRKSYDKLSLRGGLRLEYTQIATLLQETGTSSPNDMQYLNLFPSLGAQYALGEGRSLVLGYSRRLNRPYYKDLNPSLSYMDQYSYSQGNPYLRPEYSQNVDLSYQHNNILLTAYGIFSRGSIGQVLLPQGQDAIVFNTKRNLDQSTSLGLSLNTSYQLGQKLEGYVYAFGSYDQSIFSENGISVNQQIVNGGANLGLSYRITDQFKLGSTAYYYSPSQQGLYRLRANYALNLSASYSKGPFAASLQVQDLFRTGRWDSRVSFGNLDAHWVNRWETRVFYLSLRYRFGNNDVRNKGDYQKETDSAEGDRIR